MIDLSTVQYKSAARILSVLTAAAFLATCGGSDNDTPAQTGANPQVRQLGQLDSTIAADLTQQVKIVPFTLRQDSPIVLQGKMMSTLQQEQNDELKATYRAGHTIVLLDATMEHIAALHGIIGGGVTYDSKDAKGVMAYTLHQENRIPHARLLSQVQLSPLRTAKGEPDPTGSEDNKQAYKKAVEITVAELSHLPIVTSPVPPRGTPPPPVDWQTIPTQWTTLTQNSSAGVYNTSVKVYSLHQCVPDVKGDTPDYYMVTALADWTATNAKFQSAASTQGRTSMYYDENNDLWVVANWRDDPTLTFCSSPSSFGYGGDANVCRYINYPLQYSVEMQPLSNGAVIQTEAKPPAQQGQATSYTSGFSWTLGGTVNVNGMGPGAGLSGGVTWNNSTTTTVPPVRLDLSQTPHGEGAQWTYRYCTTGLEPDAGGNCTNHVQMVKDVCQAQLGDFSGTNPQQGQTAKGAFSDAVHTALWQAGKDTRTGTTFDITVSVTPTIGNTTANLWSAEAGDAAHAGCNTSDCACVSKTEKTQLTDGGSYTFKIPLPSTICTPPPP
jgi:hypothetical protein